MKRLRKKAWEEASWHFSTKMKSDYAYASRKKGKNHASRNTKK